MRKALFIFLILATQLSKAQSVWSELNGPFGGDVRDVEMATDGTLYAATVYGAYRSADDGATWSRITDINSYDVADITVDASTGRIYAVARSSSNNFYFTDNGTNWTVGTITGVYGLTKIAVHPGNSQILFVLSNNPGNTVYRSTDGGATWPSSPSFTFPNNVSSIAINSSGATVVACDGNSAYKALSGSTSFSQFAIDGSTTRTIRSLTTDGDKFYAITSDNGVIYRLDNVVAGTWTNIVTASLTETSKLYTGRISINQSGSLYMALDGSYWQCDNPTAGSPTWTRNGDLDAWNLNRITAGTGTSIFVASGTHGVRKSTDQGVTFVASSTGIKAINSPDFAETEDGKLLLVGQQGFFLSLDQGQSWEENITATNNSDVNFRRLEALDDGSILMLGSGATRKYVGSDALTVVGNTPAWLQYFAFSKTTTPAQNLIIASDYNNFYKSTDDGVNWTTLSYTNFPASFSVQGMVLENQSIYSDQGYLFVDVYDNGLSARKLYRVKQGSTTAELLTLPVAYTNILSVQVLHGQTADILYVLTQNSTQYSISYSKDHGDTWQTVTPSVLTNSNAQVISVRTDETVAFQGENILNVFGYGGKIFTSFDNGVTWQTETHTGPRTVFRKMKLTGQNYGYLAGENTSMFKSVKPVLVPAAPSNFAVDSYTFNRATLTWKDNSSLEEVFGIEKSVGNNTNYQLETEALTNSTSVQFTNLLPNTHYYYRIYAKGAGGQSPYANEIDFTTLDNSCALSIPDNRSWSSRIQVTRGPDYASLSPANHLDPDQSYTLTFDATGTELEGAAKVYAYAGVALTNDNTWVWSNIIGNWGVDDGLGQMTHTTGNLWTLTLGPTLRQYFGVAPGTSIYWLSAVFSNADGSVKATNNGIEQDTFISIEAGEEDTSVGINLSDEPTRRYKISNKPGDFFEACGVVTTLYAGFGSWDSGTNIIQFVWKETEDSGYDLHYTNKSQLNTNDPAPADSPNLYAVPFGSATNFLRWNKTDYTTKYRIQRGLGTFECPSDIGGTGIAYSTTDMFDGVTSYPGTATGTVDFVSIGSNNYSVSDYSFGYYDVVGYTSGGPAGSTFIFTHDCQRIRATGGDFGEGDWIYQILDVTATTLTFHWTSSFLESGTTTLTRSDGKSWLTQLSQDVTIPVLTDVQYPAISYIDADPALQVGATYTYRVASVNSAGISQYSPKVVVTCVDPHFAPQLNELNEANYSAQGITATDLDGDGNDDVVMSTFYDQFTERQPPLIFKNNQDGTFTKIAVAGMEVENMGVYRGGVAADFNGDQMPDLLFSRVDAGVDNSVLKDILLLNDGNFNFTKTKVITKPGYTTQFSSHTALDFDNDGILDLFTVGSTGNAGEIELPSFLWKNDGTGAFTQVTTAGTLTSDLIRGIDASTVDYDNDGDLDLFVMERKNTPAPNRLYKNNGDGTFTRVTGLAFDTDVAAYWRTSSWGDVDNDGDMDLFVATQYSNPTGVRSLYFNNGNGTFTNQTGSAVTEKDATCFGSTFGDLDNDGDLDLVTVSSEVGGNKIFFNDGAGVFTKYTTVEAINGSTQSNIGVALSDIDNDGFLDIIPSPNTGLPLSVFKNLAKGVSGNHWIKIKLNGTQSSKSAIGARVKATVGSLHQIREVSARTGYGSQNSLTVHFGLGSAATVDQLVITWPSGNVMTLTNLAADQLYVIDEDLTGPVWSSSSPADQAVGVALDATLELTFDEPPVGAPGKNIKLFAGTNLTTPAFTIAASDGVTTNNTIVYTLPSAMEVFTQYTVEIDAGAITDAFQNPSTTIPSTWVFHTIDNEFPAITFTEIPLLDAGFGTTKLSITATDNNQLASAKMYYRGVTAKNFNTPLDGTQATDVTKWEFGVAENLFDAMGLEYYFTATDPAGNGIRSPADSTKYYKTRIDYPVGKEPAVSLVGSGGSITGYKIIAIPYELSNDGIFENFDELGGADPTKYRFIRYHETPAPGWDEYPGALAKIQKGAGYFINVRENTDITLKEGKVPDYSQDNLFSMDLKKGWNQIGNPYTTQIVWSDVLSFNSNPAGVGNLFKFNSNYFEDTAGAIEPLEGGFVQVDNDVTLKIPFKGFTTGGRIRNTIENHSIDKESWIAPLTLRQADLTYVLGSVGMHPDANEGKDKFDLVTPPSFGQFAEVNFAHPEFFMKRFTRDVVDSRPEYDWSLTVDGNLKGVATLSWDSESMGQGKRDLILFDLALQKPVDMRKVSSYSFDPSVSAKFKIYYGENAMDRIKSGFVWLGDPYPNPATATSTVRYALPGGVPSYHVSLNIYDRLGRHVTTLVQEDKEPGFYDASWSGESATNGMYIYRLSVESNGKRQTISKKLLINN